MENNEKTIRILNIVPNMRAAGIETFIMNVYRHIDRDKVQFDFIVHNKERQFYDDEIERLGGKIYRLSYKDDKNLLKYIKDLNNFFKTHKEYRIVHGHMQSMMPIYLAIAKKNKVPIRIAHSHNANYEKTFKGVILHIMSRFTNLFSTDNIACSNLAGKYLFSKKKYEIIYNGIDISRFKYDSKKRQKLRDKNFEKFIIGHVGRFELQKNHEFLIELFYEVVQKMPNAELFRIGEGKLENKIIEKVHKLNLMKKVHFLGIISDMSEIYNSFDCFLLPSLYEGLPVVGVEAQINSLPCIFSNNITKELKISDNCYFCELDKQQWLEKILEIQNKKSRNLRNINYEQFDIDKIAKDIQERYEKYER